MRDASFDSDSPQGRKHGILRAARMENDRQPVTARQPELRGKECFLPRSIEPRNMMIQPDFPDGHGAALREQRIEAIEIGFIGTVDVERMNAERRKNAGYRFGQRQHWRKPRAVDGGHDELLDARRACARKHRRAIRIELGCVEMKMRVDQHDSNHASRPRAHGKHATDRAPL